MTVRQKWNKKIKESVGSFGEVMEIFGLLAGIAGMLVLVCIYYLTWPFLFLASYIFNKDVFGAIEKFMQRIT